MYLLHIGCLCYLTTHNQLVIALEPECAALYVRSQEDKHGAFKSLNYGVVDCGVGTVDIAYHGIEGHEECNFVLNELDSPSGGLYGGMCVDEAFEALLEEVLGDKL